MAFHPDELHAFLEYACRVIDERRALPRWSRFCRSLAAMPTTAGFFALTNCASTASDATTPPPPPRENAASDQGCSNEVDDDCDGLVDCDDTDCVYLCAPVPIYGTPY